VIEGETFEDLRRRAAEGSAFDQEQMGAFLAMGSDGICEKDEVEARYWYLQAVKQGYLDAKYNLSIMLIEGAGGPKKIVKALFLLEQAAAEHHYSSCRFLSAIYEAGEYGKEVDDELSRYWWREYERIMALDITEVPDFGTPLPDFELSE
jgi:TPR repeat protein